MKRVTKIFGPPGTGKTTRLLNIVDESINKGIRPDRIAFLAFTKRAAQEAIERAMARFNLSLEQLPWFRTIHSMAFRDISASRDDIMQEEHYQELGRIGSFEFTKLDEELQMPIGTAIGDRLMKIEHLARLRKIPIEEQWNESGGHSVPFPALLQWVESLATYKHSHGLLDYTDLLEQFNTELDVDVVIVDEAQDLSRLQWDVIWKASARAKEIYLAGDDDQCIYEWAGADVNQFLSIDATNRVLPVSYRLPGSVYRLALTVLENISVRQPKQWSSRAEEGHIDWLSNESLLDLSKGKWLLIARNRRFLARFDKLLQMFGFVYTKDGRHSTNTPETRAIIAWESWRKNNPIKATDLNLIKSVMPELQNWHPHGDTYLRDAPLPEHIKQMTWMDVLQIDPIYREYIRSCLANGESLLKEPRIIVSTIHKVKGTEADHVALITDITDRPWSQLREDSEQRVLYVAVTRARQTLSIIRAQTAMSYRL
jgi:DNA helicase-2/ATP-dependent DNA helicase PcrA